jgi:hypothetical protein
MSGNERAALERLEEQIDGTPAAANTVNEPMRPSKSAAHHDA